MSQRVKVKICGIRTLEEARAASDYGADALGFNFWARSPRFIEPIKAKNIIRQLPPFINCVGVFVNESMVHINEIIDVTGIHSVQLHGDEEPEFILQIHSLSIIKAFRVGEDFELDILKRYPAKGFLLDAKVKGEYGGTGVRFDWQVAIEAKKIAPVILAGGLNCDNVAQAITQVHPFAIDVCSGVEAEPGRKDLDKLRDFMLAVEIANESIRLQSGME